MDSWKFIIQFVKVSYIYETPCIFNINKSNNRDIPQERFNKIDFILLKLSYNTEKYCLKFIRPWDVFDK